MRKIIATIVVASFAFAAPAFAEARVALVIGNGAYENVSRLTNPPNDARLMERTLKDLGFDVVSAVDTTQKGIKRAVKRFGERLEAGGKDAVGLCFYAGHGVQVKGVNYLIPIDADIRDEGDVDIEAVSANSILSRMEHSGARLSFVILDACRNNPFGGFGRSADRGLARMDAPAGSLVAYATSPGDVAADGTGQNSPYTAALAHMMKRPGLTVEQMFRSVRNILHERTGERQTPWESSSLTGGDFFFAGLGDAATTSTADLDTVLWQSVRSSNNPAMFEEYLRQFPNGIYAAVARLKIEELKNPPQPKTSNPDKNYSPEELKEIELFNQL